MIRPHHRRVASLLVMIGIWRIIPASDDLFRCNRLRPRWGTKWLWDRMRAAQLPDQAKHAPCCPANRWAGAELVFVHCNCGAARAVENEAPPKRNAQ